MTKSELLAALADLPDDADIVLDAGIDTLLDIRVWWDEDGGYVAVARDEEGREFTEAVQAAFLALDREQR